MVRIKFFWFSSLNSQKKFNHLPDLLWRKPSRGGLQKLGKKESEKILRNPSRGKAQDKHTRTRGLMWLLPPSDLRDRGRSEYWHFYPRLLYPFCHSPEAWFEPLWRRKIKTLRRCFRTALDEKKCFRVLLSAWESIKQLHNIIMKIPWTKGR